MFRRPLLSAKNEIIWSEGESFRFLGVLFVSDVSHNFHTKCQQLAALIQKHLYQYIKPLNLSDQRFELAAHSYPLVCHYAIIASNF